MAFVPEGSADTDEEPSESDDVEAKAALESTKKL